MKLANRAFIIALTMLALIVSMSAQTPRPNDDNRNTAPTVGTGGSPGGPTGLFTIYDGQTLRRGEFTFSAAYSNYDRDPGDVDISEVPVSFQIGLSDHLELFFNTDAYRGIKVNSPGNLSSFYLPNSRLRVNGQFTTPGAIVQGVGSLAGQAVFRPSSGAFTQFPFIGGSAGVVGTIGSPVTGGAASNFPGVGSPFGSILPGVVLQTTSVVVGNPNNPVIVPTVFSVIPSYLPDAPFINRTWGQSAFGTMTAGAKYRFTGPNNPYGIGVIPFYRFFGDKANDFSGFNQLQRGASPGGNRGDFGLVVFGDARLRKWANVSANVGYIYNSSVKGDFANGEATLLDRPDELLAGVGVDFPINRYFQPIVEYRTTQYVGGRTPNAFENDPQDFIGGVRLFPARYVSIGLAYRYNLNQQDADSFEDGNFTTNTLITGTTPRSSTNNFSGVPPGFRTSTDPEGFIFQIAAGRRNKRGAAPTPNGFANVTNLTVNPTEVVLPCPAGQQPREGVVCSDNMTVQVTTTAVDPENDVLTYNYTVSQGRIVGTGASVSWDLTGVAPGTYTITAAVDDGCGLCGQTKTQTITVRNCDCVIPTPPTPPCLCPDVSVNDATTSVKPGETLTFTANVSGSSTGDVRYNWEVENGVIASGQGTSTITVTTSNPGNVTARVNINNDCTTCTKSAAGTGIVTELPKATLIDTINAATDDDVKARFEAVRNALGNDPNATVVVINYGTARQIATRERQIQKAIRFLQIDASRVTVLRGGDRGTGIVTEVWVVPAGATPPTPQ